MSSYPYDVKELAGLGIDPDKGEMVDVPQNPGSNPTGVFSSPSFMDTVSSLFKPAVAPEAAAIVQPKQSAPVTPSAGAPKIAAAAGGGGDGEGFTAADAAGYGALFAPLVTLAQSIFAKKPKKPKVPVKGPGVLPPSGMSGTMKGLLIVGGVGVVGMMLYAMKGRRTVSSPAKAVTKRRRPRSYFTRRFYYRPKASLRRAVRKYTRRKSRR